MMSNSAIVKQKLYKEKKSEILERVKCMCVHEDVINETLLTTWPNSKALFVKRSIKRHAKF
jgi:hypothetical protein